MESSTEAVKKVLSLPEACAYLGGISRPTLYRLLGDGSLGSLKIGTRRFILRESLDDFLRDRSEGGSYED